MPIQIKIQKGKNNVMTRFRQMLSANLKGEKQCNDQVQTNVICKSKRGKTM
jgi:hypothetical protein